jgi:transcriptional regulator with XRE-family HTH domain
MDKNTPYWGNRLRELMELMDITPSELARRAGVTRTAVSKWQREPYPTLSAEKAATLQAIFGVPYYKIFPLIVPTSPAVNARCCNDLNGAEALKCKLTNITSSG